jgi:hypothetical protein
VVSSLYHLKDSENRGEDAAFFVFPDLSVRMEGSYRLKLSLFEVVGCIFFISCHASFVKLVSRTSVRYCKAVYSTPFYVYTAKKFPGMEGTLWVFRLPSWFSPHLQSLRSSLALWLTRVSKYVFAKTFARGGALWSPHLPNQLVLSRHHLRSAMHPRRLRMNQRRRKVAEYA